VTVGIMTAIQKEKTDTKWSERTDGELVLLTLEGKQEAFGMIVERYRSGAVRLASAIVGDWETARDISQDAFIKAYRALNTFDIRSPFLPWFYRILRNTCMDQLRRKKRFRQVVENVVHSSVSRGDLWNDISRSDMAVVVRKAVSRLKDTDREIIELRHFSGLAYEEISELLGIPKGTVMSRLHYARKILHDILVKEFGIEAGEI
jgi:RNA polymerase sigma-70 factor, ECF subfamily